MRTRLPRPVQNADSEFSEMDRFDNCFEEFLGFLKGDQF